MARKTKERKRRARSRANVILAIVITQRHKGDPTTSNEILLDLVEFDRAAAAVLLFGAGQKKRRKEKQ